MTAVNHSVMGAIIAVSVQQPILALPLALASHFLLDALPHFGAHTVAKSTSREFRAVLLTDAFLTSAFMVTITFAGYRAGLPIWLAPTGAMLGWLPDVMWYKHYRSDLRGEEKQWGKIRRFHKKIQRYEVAWGWRVEAVWFLLTVWLLGRLLFG